MAHPLLSTKFFIPRPRAGTVDRQRVSQLLDDGRRVKLTLVSAQAGFGKTTAISAWVHRGPGADAVAWVSLEASDAEADTFWTYVVTALARRVPTVGDDVLALLGAQGPPTTAALTELINGLAEAPDDVTLVLDDYHLVDCPDVAAGVTFLVNNLPPNAHLIISTRADPDLPLARLRAQGEVVEVRASDLRFTSPETAGYLQQAGLELAPSDLAVLDDRTEGWAAALQLAVLSMRGREDISDFIADFAGDDRFIVDYLAEEVLARQPRAVREFLVRTSVLDRLTGSLCDAVTGQGDGAATLAELERQNLFITALDARRHTYRYHHLFADVLRTHLTVDSRGPSAEQLHGRASRWYEDDGQLLPAVHHALASRDYARAASLMEAAIPHLLRERQEAIIASWADELPEEVVRARPVLAMGFVSALMFRNQFEAVPPLLDAVERLLAGTAGRDAADPRLGPDVAVHDPGELPPLAGKVELHRAGLALVTGDLEGAHRHVERATALAAPDDHPTKAGAWGVSGLAHWYAGDLDALHRCYSSCVDELRQVGHVSDILGCTSTLADVRVAQGRLNDAQATLEQALQLATAHPGVPRGTADMHTGLAAVLLERNDLAGAESRLRLAQDGGDLAGMPQNPCVLRVTMALLRHARGDHDEALALLDEAERLYVADFHPDVRPVHATRARLLIATGRLSEASAWAGSHNLSHTDDVSYLHEYEHVTLAMLMLARHQAVPSTASLDDVTSLLRRLHDSAERGGRTGTLIEVLVLESLASLADGRAADAAAQLGQALGLGEPEGQARVFTQHGALLLPVIRQLPAALRGTTYVRALAAACGAEEEPVTLADRGREQQALVDPLSSRELEVLRLLATDLTGPEVARHLVVSLNTVRTHTRNVYAKLGVNGRRAAVSRAHQLGLLGRRDR